MKRFTKPLLALVVVVAIAAVAYMLLKDSDPPGAGHVVQISLDGDGCWNALVPVAAESDPAERSGCGQGTITLGRLTGTVVVTKNSDQGILTVTTLVDDVETAREQTDEPFGSVTVGFE